MFAKYAIIGDRALLPDQLYGFIGGFIPKPRIFEGGPLRFVYVQPFAFEEDVVIFVGFEGRVEIDKIDKRVWQLAHNVKIVAEVEPSKGFGRIGGHAAPVELSNRSNPIRYSPRIP